MGMAEWRGRGDKHDCRYRECLAQTARENELRNSPCAQDFRTPGGRRQPEEEEEVGGGGGEGVREMRVTRLVTEFPDRPLLDDPPSGDAHRRDPILAKWSERLCIEPPPPPPPLPIQRTEKCHWLPEFRVKATTRSTDREGIVVLADQPPTTKGTRIAKGDQLSRLNKNYHY